MVPSALVPIILPSACFRLSKHAKSLSFPDSTGRNIQSHSFSPTSAVETPAWYSRHTIPVFRAYEEAEDFMNPMYFQLADFESDADTRAMFAVMITLCLLPVSMSTSNQLIKPGYDSYQPVLAAR